MFHRSPSAVATILSTAFFLCFAPSTSAESQQITQLIPTNNEWGCVLQQSENLVTFKGDYGVSEEVSAGAAAKKFNKKRKKLKKGMQRLKDQAPLNANKKQKLKTKRKKLKETTQLRNAAKACKRGEVELQAASFAQGTFAFYCQHGFNARAVAEGENNCGVDLRSLQNLKNFFNAQGKQFSVQKAWGLIYKSLSFQCQALGGTLLTPEKQELFTPLYHAYCSTEEEYPETFSVGTMPPTLGMETVNEDCLTAGNPSGGGAKDPCDCYDPDNPPKTGGGGGGGESSPPTDEDCFVLRMETVNEDC